MNILDALPFVIVFAGIFIGFRLRFFMFLHPFKCIRAALQSLKTKDSRHSFFLSLAGTLGVGNIVGVAFGLFVGGAGSVLWLLVSVLFSSVIKFAEVASAKDKSFGNVGGVMYVIKSSFGKKFKWLGIFYAFFCLLLSFTMGAGLQARSAFESIVGDESKGFFIITLILAIATFFAVRHGSKKIEEAVSFIIPIAALVYIALCISVIFIHRQRIPVVISDIFKSAFRPRAAVGGIGSFIISREIKEGFCRGLLSNESGAGTSSMAHSRNESDDPVAVGILGIFEVFIDTALLCTLTALAVLSSLPSLEEYSSGMEIICAVICTLSPRLLPFLSFSIVCFAYSTLICWYYYGKLCADFLFPKLSFIYMPAYLFFIFLSAFIPSNALIVCSDYLLFFMTLISLSTIIKNSDRLKNLSEKSGFIKRSRKNSYSRKNTDSKL